VSRKSRASITAKLESRKQCKDEGRFMISCTCIRHRFIVTVEIKTRRRVAKDVDVEVEGRAVGCRGLS
jgi:hypothetical protein